MFSWKPRLPQQDVSDACSFPTPTADYGPPSTPSIQAPPDMTLDDSSTQLINVPLYARTVDDQSRYWRIVEIFNHNFSDIEAAINILAGRSCEIDHADGAKLRVTCGQLALRGAKEIQAAGSDWFIEQKRKNNASYMWLNPRNPALIADLGRYNRVHECLISQNENDNNDLSRTVLALFAYVCYDRANLYSEEYKGYLWDRCKEFGFIGKQVGAELRKNRLAKEAARKIAENACGAWVEDHVYRSVFAYLSDQGPLFDGWNGPNNNANSPADGGQG